MSRTYGDGTTHQWDIVDEGSTQKSDILNILPQTVMHIIIIIITCAYNARWRMGFIRKTSSLQKNNNNSNNRLKREFAA